MATWQVILFALFVALPFVLLADFWPRGERLDFRGRPVPRDWRPTSRPPDDEAAH